MRLEHRTWNLESGIRAIPGWLLQLARILNVLQLLNVLINTESSPVTPDRHLICSAAATARLADRLLAAAERQRSREVLACRGFVHYNDSVEIVC